MDTLRNLELPLTLPFCYFFQRLTLRLRPLQKATLLEPCATFSMCVLLTASPPNAHRCQFGAQEWLEL